MSKQCLLLGKKRKRSSEKHWGFCQFSHAIQLLRSIGIILFSISTGIQLSATCSDPYNFSNPCLFFGIRVILSWFLKLNQIVVEFIYDTIYIDYPKLLFYCGVYRFERHILYTSQCHEMSTPYLKIKKCQWLSQVTHLRCHSFQHSVYNPRIKESLEMRSLWLTRSYFGKFKKWFERWETGLDSVLLGDIVHLCYNPTHNVIGEIFTHMMKWSGTL